LIVAGAFRDNSNIANEGVSANKLSSDQKSQLITLTTLYLDHLPSGPKQAKLASIYENLNQTYFCWIGGIDSDSAFYYRIQSPVILIEFDHHSGVFLSNNEPKKFHIHTMVRTPNGNDYGMALLKKLEDLRHPSSLLSCCNQCQVDE